MAQITLKHYCCQIESNFPMFMGLQSGSKMLQSGPKGSGVIFIFI